MLLIEDGPIIDNRSKFKKCNRNKCSEHLFAKVEDIKYKAKSY
jgi:hypothetical protein